MNIEHKKYSILLRLGRRKQYTIYTETTIQKTIVKKTNDKCRLYKYSLSYTSVFVKYDLLIKQRCFL